MKFPCILQLNSLERPSKGTTCLNTSKIFLNTQTFMKQTKETSRNTIKTPVQYLKQGNKNKSALKHLWNTLKTSRIPLESFLNHPNMHTNHPKYGHPLPPRMVKPSPVWESKMWRKVWSPTISRMVTSHPSVTSTHNLQNIHQPSQVWSPTTPKDGQTISSVRV